MATISADELAEWAAFETLEAEDEEKAYEDAKSPPSADDDDDD